MDDDPLTLDESPGFIQEPPGQGKLIFRRIHYAIILPSTLSEISGGPVGIGGRGDRAAERAGLDDRSPGRYSRAAAK
jgi:hypothetical protein